MSRLTDAWRKLEPDQRLVAFASLGLFVSMFLPWYQQNAVINVPRAAPLQSRNLDAFEVFSFVEAAVLLVAVAVAYMLFARAEQRDFQLPGGDGGVVLAAGLWTAALLVFRLFDKPGISSHGVAGNVGVQWGIFFALAAAGMLAYTGARMRASEHPSPQPGPAPARPRPSAGQERRQPLWTPPQWDDTTEGDVTAKARAPVSAPRSAPVPSTPVPSTPEPSTAAGAEAVAADPAAGDPGPADPPAAGKRPRFPPAPSEQMSFEDGPAEHKAPRSSS
jgi:hypothetical protein